MGQWNRRRWWSRKRNFYQEGFPANNYNFETEIVPSEYEDNIPSWEKQFCKAASVPWGKVLFVKKYMNMHGEILKWNDSSGEEAFNSAKQRFWADINGLPCDICLPDPNMYIENVDWDACIDPKLIAELDLEFFDVDNAEKADEKTTNSNQEPKMQTNVQNPWEPTDGAEKDVGSSWDINKAIGLKEEKIWNRDWSSWGQSNQNLVLKEEKRWDRGWDSWGQSNQNSNALDNNNINNGRIWREPRSGYNNNTNNQWETRNKDFGRTNGGAWRSTNTNANNNNSRKREWIHQDASRYKTCRFNDRNNNNWRKEREGQGQKSSGFAIEQPWTQWRQVSRQ